MTYCRIFGMSLGCKCLDRPHHSTRYVSGPMLESADCEGAAGPDCDSGQTTFLVQVIFMRTHGVTAGECTTLSAFGTARTWHRS